MAERDPKHCKLCGCEVVAVKYGDTVAGTHAGTYVTVPDDIDLEDVASYQCEEHGTLGADDVH